jgi:hypothetical protein
MPASSILPVAYYKNKLYFLMGKENPMEDSAKGFSDFGGSIDAGETALHSAIRECSEELTGFLGEPRDIRSHIKRNGGVFKLLYTYPEDPTRTYLVHIVHMEYDPMLPVYYNQNHAFLWKRMNKKMLNDSKLFEKIQIEWICECDLDKYMPKYRPFYREIVKQIHTQIPKIREFIRKNHRKCNTRSLRNPRGTRKLVGGR